MGLTGLQIIWCSLAFNTIVKVLTAQGTACDVKVPCDCCNDNLSCSDPDYNCNTNACKDGYYGIKCISACPDSCISCHRDFGKSQVCFECVNGKYGQNCNSSCSRCLSCNKTTGVCLKCAGGYYGQNCSNSCSDNCVSKICDVHSGWCNACTNGYYGHTCNEICPNKCKEVICDRDSGLCLKCTTGYYGNYCNKTCSINCRNKTCNFNNGTCDNCVVGLYGTYCNKTCPSSCNQTQCTRDRGTCTFGCYKNFEGGQCDECTKGKYGHQCDSECPPNCKNGECDRNNGTCKQGCDTGFSDDRYCCANTSYCDICSSQSECTQCKVGTYGKVCNHTCPSNCDGPCDKNTGHCNKCKLNYYGLQCETNCSETCLTTDSTISRCNVENGHCNFGCHIGYHGEMCNNECTGQCNGSCNRQSGECDACLYSRYGTFCEQLCANACVRNDNETVCSRNNGRCLLGCVPGSYGDMCRKSCSEHCKGSCDRQSGKCHACMFNRFGKVCDRLCPNNCVRSDNESVCSRSEGRCLYGCLTGHYGEECVNNCSSGCRDTNCNRSTGHCINGCVEGFTGLLCLRDNVQPTGESNAGFPTTQVGLAGGGAVVLAIVVFVVTVVLRKRRSDHTKRHPPKPQKLKVPDKVKAGSNGIYENAPSQDAHDVDDEDTFVPEINQVEFKNENTYYNSVHINSKLRTEELYRYLSKSDEIYQKEFLLLPTGLIKPYNDAKLPTNTTRNRYNMVYPYDDSRVKVNDGNSDYINASFIEGYKKKHAYIACLGPTKKNLGDFSLFWKMIWQEKVETIVMVTKLKEASGMKCDQYWPKVGKTVKYGNVKVQSTGEEEYAEFVVRNMTLSMDKEERQFHHIHFTAWPDKGVPSDVISIVNLRNKVTRMRRKFDGPLVVHCSAGIGRTGTYIALDILIRQGLVEQSVDVLGCVMNMRQQRVHMVQTVDQYKYLHHAVLWSLSIDTEPVPADKFFDLSWVYKDDGLAKMLRQLQMENWYDTEEEKKAVEANTNISFVNRRNADIPGSRHAVNVMSCETNKPMKAGYINAVLIDGYRRQNRFIAAQTPLPETASTFLDMVVQRQVGCIIDLEPADSSQDDVGEYLPEDNDELQNGNVVFKSTKKQQGGGYVKREIEVIDDKQARDSRSITHYQFTEWPKSKAVPDSVQFIKFIHEVERLIIKTEQTGPILVHCMNGAERSSLFCAMWLLIERIGADHSVSVLNTLRQVKSRRRKAFPNKEQIDFCFQGVATHLNQLNLNVYSNT